jgi:hypothetical protein
VKFPIFTRELSSGGFLHPAGSINDGTVGVGTSVGSPVGEAEGMGVCVLVAGGAVRVEEGRTVGVVELSGAATSGSDVHAESVRLDRMMKKRNGLARRIEAILSLLIASF